MLTTCVLYASMGRNGQFRYLLGYRGDWCTLQHTTVTIQRKRKVTVKLRQLFYLFIDICPPSVTHSGDNFMLTLTAFCSLYYS